MNRFLVLILTFIQITSAAWASEKVQSEPSELAKKMAKTLVLQNFNCSMAAPSAERGYRCRGRITHYPDFVNIFIPGNLTQEPEVIAFHFHGFNTCGSTLCHFNLTTGDGDYGKFLSHKAHRTILVIPESQGKVQTYVNFFQNGKVFDNFIDDIKLVTRMREVIEMKVSSHSGADRMIERLSNWQLYGKDGIKSQYLENIRAIALFDSLYDFRTPIAAWVSQSARDNPEFYFLGSYVHGSITDRYNAYMYMKWLETQLPASPQIRYLDLSNTYHFAIMKDGQMSEFLAD